MSIGPRTTSAEDRLQRLLDVQSLLAGVAREIGPALQLDSVLRTVLTAMRSMVDFDGGTVRLTDDRGVYVAASDPAPTSEASTARLPLGTGAAGRAISTGQTIHSADLRSDARADPERAGMGAEGAVCSYLAVPLVVLGKVIGAIQIDSAEVDAFDADDVAALEGLAGQVGGAIESARRREEMVELERMKADFIARISHELRTPLTVMGGFTDTLILHGDRLPPEQHAEVLGRIKTSVSRLQTLIEEILAVASLDAGMTRVKPENIDVRALLDEARHLSIDESRVEIVCPAQVRLVSDPIILRHLVNQLIDNALKYGGDAVVSAARDEHGNLTIAVRDHGPGIVPSDRERIFERFYRGNHTGAGMGLGLPVVRQLAASLDAGVSVEDAPGGGALFTLRWN